jgi:hypothetical protein
MAGWAPVSAPSAAETFMGIDRTDIDTQRASGVRFNGNGGNMEETLLDACARADENGVDIDTIWVGSRRMSTAQKELTSARIRDNKGDGDIGYTSLQVNAPIGNGTIDIIHEKDIDNAYAWGFDMSDWYLRTAGEAPDLLNHDGLGPLRQAADADAVQGRVGSYGNFFHENPGNSLIITW